MATNWQSMRTFTENIIVLQTFLSLLRILYLTNVFLIRYAEEPTNSNDMKKISPIKTLKTFCTYLSRWHKKIVICYIVNKTIFRERLLYLYVPLRINMQVRRAYKIWHQSYLLTDTTVVFGVSLNWKKISIQKFA